MTTAPLHESSVPDADAPQFSAEWQRRAFGVAVALSEFGHYEWSAFQQQLIDAIGSGAAPPASEQSRWDYYEHWLTALERVVIGHGLVEPEELPAPES